MPVSWPQTFLHLITLNCFQKEEGNVVIPGNCALAEVYASQKVTVYTTGTSNFNSYFFGCITVLTSKCHFWLSKLVSLQKVILLEDLFANYENFLHNSKKMPFFLQDASDITIEKCLLLHCSNIGIRQRLFMLSVVLASHLLWQGLLIKVNLLIDLILSCITVLCQKVLCMFISKR